MAGQIIEVDFTAKAINVASLKANRQLAPGLIQAATTEVTKELADEHAAEPIKSMDDIMRVSRYLISQERYRDNMLFIVGINTGLRVSDLRLLRFSDLINETFTFKDALCVLEQKTKSTRKVKRNRYISINTAIVEAVTLYLENAEGPVTLSDYMFRGEGNRSKNSGQPIHRNTVDHILKDLGRKLRLPNRMATHSLRKTFAYHQMVMSGNDPRKLLLLQKMFGHSTVTQTLDYIGITSEEIDEAYLRLNLGSVSANYLNSTVYEADTSAISC